MDPSLLELLRCPATGGALTMRDGGLESVRGGTRYELTASGIPLFGAGIATAEARAQQARYDAMAQSYVANLSYAHTREYGRYLDQSLLARVDMAGLDVVAEICCGRGEAFRLLGGRIGVGVGLDISTGMLEVAVRELAGPGRAFVQGDATRMPFAESSFGSVFMLGGIHHVPDRRRLFAEVHRILRPGGCLYFREPLNDFMLWRALRAVIYRLSPRLDAASERPLRRHETVPLLDTAGLTLETWAGLGFIGFGLFMNSDVLVFNRLFRFLPGIRFLVGASIRADEALRRLPGLEDAGLQVIGIARKGLKQADT